ncbi:sarcosine oxidase subunit beta [Candidatus Endobugula sertula]|uniref:Sarcosine oxidase subunit beta n=1 Tax=Candidatus Endobugula sertula TaxID=62101 RepID=A0A1D2QQA6_9GAMM|nr:sarcosine oxidase subunit beta [Candidatus Endobugula sertula]
MPYTLLKYGLNKNVPFKKHIGLPQPTELKKSYDVVIIGGGSHGIAIAYYLAKYHGITNVAVLEKAYLGKANIAYNITTVRSNYLTPEEVKFYAQSLKLFKRMSHEFDFNMTYSQRGQLTLAHTDAAIRSFRQQAEINQYYGSHSKLIGPKDIQELVPALNMNPAHKPILAGLWHIDGVTTSHNAVTFGYAKEATKRGVELHQLTEVTDIIVENGKVTGINTNRGKVKCGVAVQAVAEYSSLIAEKAGFKVPVISYPLQAIVSQPMKPLLDPLVSSSALHCYVQQTGHGEILFGGGYGSYPPYSTRATLELKETLLAHAIEMFSFVADLRLLRQWTGVAEMTSDCNPIMGLSPVENYYLDAGWGTWGFKSTPICGKTMAKLIASGGKVPDLIAPFAMDRFHRLTQVNRNEGKSLRVKTT